MADIIKQIIERPIRLADKIIKESDFACIFKQECADIKRKTEKLRDLLRQAAHKSSDLCERPTRRIIVDTEQFLDKALQLVFKCGANCLQRMFTSISAEAIRESSLSIEYSIGNVAWLLRISTPSDERDDKDVGAPPMAADEPIICLIWEKIATVSCGTHDDRADAAAALLTLASDEGSRRVIIEESGVPPLLKLAKVDGVKGQESTIEAIRVLGCDPES